MKHYRIQLVDALTQKAISASGGKVYVAQGGLAAKQTLYTKAGAALSNPVALNNGMLEFYVADTVVDVDLFIQAPSGHFVVVKDVAPSGPNSIYIDKSKADTVMVIPFAIADTSAAAETDTGFDLPAKALVKPQGQAVDVLTADSGITIDVGTDSGDSGDADGFVDGLSVATATLVKATNANGSVTLGAKLYVQDSANAGDDFPEADSSQAGKSVTYTLSAGADTAAGFIIMPIQLPYASL